MPRSIHTLLLVTLLAIGCKKHDAEPADNPAAAKPGPAESKPTETTPAATPPFAEFGSNEDALKKWQGAWVLETGSLNHYEAWDVKGDELTSFDGTVEQKRKLQILAPCQAKVIKKTADGSSSHFVDFVFDGDALHAGMGDAGIKKGNKLIACGSRIFVWDGTKCTAYEQGFNDETKWESKPTECKVEGEVFTTVIPESGRKDEFLIVGDTLMSAQMKGNKVVEKATDFADAKAKLAARK